MTTTDKIIKAIIGFEDWCEQNKKRFIKKNNPELYKKLYLEVNQK